jgi:hypothetical protein
MATAVQVESLWNGLTDNSGQPLGAGKVYTYSAGTTTPVSLFTASDKSTSATNPIILDGNGKAQVWADGRYKFVVKTSADVTLYTLDNLLYGFDDTTQLYGGTSTGSANAQVVSVPATVTSYANGQTVSFIAGFTNTGATTLRFNSLPTVNLVKGHTPSSLQSGDLIAGQLYTATYHGGSFRLANYPSVADVQNGDFIWLGTTGGTATAQTASASPAITAYKAGQKFRMKIGSGLGSTGSATTPHTLAINGLPSPKNIVEQDGANPTIGSWVAGAIMEVIYDGTNFVITNDPSGWQDWSPNLRSGTATVTTPTYSLRKFIKQNKLVTMHFNFNCAITVVGTNILCDLPTNCADTGAVYLPTGFTTFSGGVVYIGQAFVNTTANELTIQANLLTATNWAISAAPTAGTRGMLTYRSV